MLRRLKENYFIRAKKDQNFYEDSFVIFSKNYSFKSYLDYLGYMELLLSLIDKVTFVTEIKERFKELLLLILSTKDFIMEDYDEKIATAKADKVLSNYINLEYQSNIFYNTYNFNIKKADYYDEVNVGVNIDEEVLKLYNNYLCSLVPKVTGNFNSDLFLDMINTAGSFSLSKDKKRYDTCLTSNNIPVGIAVAFNSAMQLLSYIKNCSSCKENHLYIFDDIEIDNRINAIKTFIKFNK